MGILKLFGLRSRKTVEVVTAKQCDINGGGDNFRMHVVNGKLLQSCGLGQNLSALISKVVILGLGS